MGYFLVTPRQAIVFFDEWPRENYQDYRGGRRGLSEYVDVIRQIEDGDNSYGLPFQNIIWRILDPNFGRSPSVKSGRTLEEDFIGLGLSFDTTVSDDLEEGHLVVKEKLANESLYITPNCENIARSMRLYAYKPKKPGARMERDGAVLEDYKDFADVVRYACMFNPIFFDIQEPPEGNPIPSNGGLGR